MKIVNKKPWWWFLTSQAWDEKYVMTLGSTIYSAKLEIEEETIVHEMVHIKQCKGSLLKSIWFVFKDSFDKENLFKAELEAYKEQMNFLIRKYPEEKDRIRQHIINKMCDPIYGFDKQKVCESLV